MKTVTSDEGRVTSPEAVAAAPDKFADRLDALTVSRSLTERNVVLMVRLPIPLSRMGRYLRGWSKSARTAQWGDYLVVIDPERSGQ